MSIDRQRVDRLVARVIERLEREGALGDGEPAAGYRAPATPATPATAPAARVRSGTGPIFETVDEAARAARAAYHDLQTVPLETRHAMVEAIRQTVRDQANALAEMAVRETGLGRVSDKIQKNLLVANRTPGPEILEPRAASGDHGLMIEEKAPYGVILSVTPSTNPSETVVNNGIGMLSGGNATIFAPHPGAKETTLQTVRWLDAAVQRAGGPPNVFSTVAEPSIDATQALMRHKLVRLLVVTGGGAVVKEAMSVGKRAITAGPGNPPVVVDTTADLARAARGIIAGASFDNNIVCTDEKEVVAVERIVAPLMEELRRAGAYELTGAELQAVERTILKENRGSRKRSVVQREFIGKDAGVILDAAGVSGPRDVRLLVARVDDGHPFLWTELMMPVIGVTSMPDVDTAIDYAREVEGGCFHTASMYSRNVEKLSRMARVMDVSIFVKNGPHFNGLGHGGEGHTSFTIASPTGEGMTTARSFTRFRRCSLIDSFRIV